MNNWLSFWNIARHTLFMWLMVKIELLSSKHLLSWKYYRMLVVYIKITNEGRIVFCIDGKNYFTHHFHILTK